MNKRMPSALSVGLSLAGAVAVGVLTALQARSNGSLGSALGDGLVAAFISFASGLGIVLVLCLVFPSGRTGVKAVARGAFRTIPAWMMLGGLAGALTVVTQSLTVATVGVALFTVGVVAGQTVNGLLLDRLGYGPAGFVAVTMPRVVGATCAVVAVVLCVVGDGSAGDTWWMLVLPFLAGAGIAWQQATNGRLRQRIDSALVATFVNFLGGTLALGIITLIHIAISGPPTTFPTSPWVYLGGALGVVYIFLSAALVRITGVLLLGLGSVVGLLSTAVVLDVIWPAPSGPSTLFAILAAVVALIGVGVAAFPKRRPRY
ncbi:transporter family-2 protein [Microbacterium endophyticum]|uniref:Transporter family-2 protein n=1 Tax=Microbacterium endophyticum TaxID=1526412 RepID=A0A7W4YLC7_9MICO|nr:DMT family transporter [Microbacterium endophyticum]MBB2975023.1 transporter family-2 protein [Microbacterium endophyticum]NIK37437.1 transporter family-2 protein [Microbacterium endophyticum]